MTPRWPRDDVRAAMVHSGFAGQLLTVCPIPLRIACQHAAVADAAWAQGPATARVLHHGSGPCARSAAQLSRRTLSGLRSQSWSVWHSRPPGSCPNLVPPSSSAILFLGVPLRALRNAKTLVRRTTRTARLQGVRSSHLLRRLVSDPLRRWAHRYGHTPRVTARRLRSTSRGTTRSATKHRRRHPMGMVIRSVRRAFRVLRQSRDAT